MRALEAPNPAAGSGAVHRPTVLHAAGTGP